MAKTPIYYLCEFSGEGERDAHTPQFKLVKQSVVVSELTSSTPNALKNYQPRKDENDQHVSFVLAFEDGETPPGEILPGDTIHEVIDGVAHSKWFVEFDDHTTAVDLRGCQFLDLSEASKEVLIGDTFYNYTTAENRRLTSRNGEKGKGYYFGKPNEK